MKMHSLRQRLLLQYLLTVGLLLAVSEGGIYGLWRWAAHRELDSALTKELEQLATVAELESGGPGAEAKTALHSAQLDDRIWMWQVLAVTDDGRIVGRWRSEQSKTPDLPALDGDGLPAEEVRIQDAEYGGPTVVRAGRLRTVRERRVRDDDENEGKDDEKESKHGRHLQMPQRVTLDIRAVVDRTAMDQQLRRLAWYLVGGFPVLLGLAAVGGIYLIRKAVRPVELAFDRERRFTGAVSHELRTPLTALRGEIDVTLRRERTPGEYVETLRQVDALVAGMTRLVEELLIMARSNAGQLLAGAREISAVTLRQAVERVISLLPGHERIMLSSMVGEETKIIGDDFLLAMAMRNLVENALVYASDGLVKVTIGINSSDGLRLAIEDQGPGMPDVVLADIHRSHADAEALLRLDGNAGFGLSIARAVVEAHSGTLTVTNRPGGGCVAEITLARSRPK